MLSARIVALLVTSSLLASAGCAGGGGGGTPPAGTPGSAVTGGTSGGTSAGTSGTTYTGTDTAPPTYAITSPARGAFVSGAAQVTLEGTADDAQSGVASVHVNGQAAALSGSSWSIPATLAFGVNTFALRVTDHAGNVAHTNWSCLYSPTFLPAGQFVENGAAVRLSQRAIDTVMPQILSALTANGALQNAIAGAAGTSAGGFSVNSITMGNPTVDVALAQGGVQVVIDLPNLSVDASFLGMSIQFWATNAHIDATVALSVANGQIVSSVPGTPSVDLQGFGSSFFGSTLESMVEQALATAIRTALPPALNRALANASQPQTVTMAGYTATLETRPRALAIDAANFRASGDANVTITSPATPPAVPGSASRGGAASAAPAFTTPHDVSLAIREDLINRILFAGWASGGGKVRIDQQFLAAHGVNLPFPLDAQFLVPFFPVLGTLRPGGGPLPVALELSALLPPVVEVTGAPSLVSTQVGEVHLSIQLDLGQGFVDVLTVALGGKIGTSASISNNELRLGVGQPVAFTVDLLQNPLGLSVPDVNLLINGALPGLVGLAGGFIPPIPLPAIPGGLQLRNVDIRQDGPGADFLTIEGDL